MLKPGYDADVVLMDEELHPVAVYVMGEKQFDV
jgi:N-acetylglucosamine-6-phosphate deacetylase